MRLIDADAFSAEMKKRQDKCAEWVETVKEEDDETYQHACGALSAFIECKLTLNKMPTVEPDMAQYLAYECGKQAEKRKTGEWIEENRRPKSMMFYCSECHRTAYDPQNHHGGRKRCRYAFCPNCGAMMRGEAKIQTRT